MSIMRRGQEDTMRLVRLGAEPTKVGADVRVALTAWGAGAEILGGVAIVGWTPPDSEQPVDAVIVLPRGVIIVVGVDLPEPALTLEAPLQTPWTVDNWPLVRTEGAVNPGLEALEAASALATSLQSHGIEPLPVTTIVAVGPYVGQVTQPTTDLHRGVRVLYPTVTSMLAAARELATYQYLCPVEPVRRLLEVLNADGPDLSVAELAAEGFPAAVDTDPASVDTISLRIDSHATAAPAIRSPSALPQGTRPTAGVTRLVRPFGTASRRIKLIAMSSVAVVVCAVIALATLLSATATTAAPPVAPVAVDGVNFVQRLSQHDTNCAQHSYGDVQAWFERQPCVGLTRQVFSTEVIGRSAAVAVAVVYLANTTTATSLRELLDTAGSGGVTDLVAEGHRFNGAPSSFAGSAEAVEQQGTQIRIVLTVWTRGASQPTDIQLRALAERGLRLPTSP